MGTTRVKNQTAPSTPATGYTELYVDSADKFLKSKDETGTIVNYGAAASDISSLTGDVTATGPGAAVATIANDAVTTIKVINDAITNPKLANMATQTFKGRTTAGTGDPEDLTATQATAILNAFVGESGSGGTKGLVPAPASGDAAAAKYLNADGAFEAPIIDSIADSDTTHAPSRNAVFDALALKQATGNYITALTGDVTASGPGSVAATIAVGAVTDTKASLASKPAVALVATTNQTLSGFGVVDGVTPAANTLILLTAQSSGSENGPWQAQSGAWTRPTWYPSAGTTQSFQFITTLVRLGTVNQGTTWRMTTAGAITIDTTATTWVITPLALGSTTLTGQAPIANGGTGQATKAAGFDALSPMTTQYDLIVGGASGTGTRLSKGADNTSLTTQGGAVAFTTMPHAYSVSSVNSNTTIVLGTIYLCDTSGGVFNMTFPSPVAKGFVTIKDKTGSFMTNNLTMVRAASEKIEGIAASKVLQTNWGSWNFISDGTDWFMV